MRLCSSKDEAIQYAAAEIIEARDTPPSARRSIKKVAVLAAACAVLFSAISLMEITKGRTDAASAAVGAVGAILLITPLFGVVDYQEDRRRHKASKLSVFDWAEEYRRSKK